jgi:phage-related minor tail protein
MSDNYPSRLWNHMSETHNLHLLCSEEADIRNCVIEDSQAQLEEALKERDEFRAMAEDLLEKNAKQAVNIVKLREALEEIASLDTSQDASPQQCEAVLIAMNTLKK